jgi:hypothetical protein
MAYNVYEIPLGCLDSGLLEDVRYGHSGRLGGRYKGKTLTDGPRDDGIEWSYNVIDARRKYAVIECSSKSVRVIDMAGYGRAEVAKAFGIDTKRCKKAGKR